MSKFAKFFTSSGAQAEIAYPTMAAMIADAATEGYKAVKPKGKEFIHESQSGNVQFIMSNGTDNKFVRISDKLNAELRAGNVKDLTQQPVYVGRAFDENKTEVGTFLVVGLSGLVTEEVTDMAAALGSIAKPAPAAK